MSNPDTTPGTDYTTVDLNATGTTAVYSSDSAAMVYGVYLRNGGGTAVVSLEVTDGTDTATLADNRGSGGANIAFGEELELAASETLQVNVTTAEGVAQSNTAVVFRSEE